MMRHISFTAFAMWLLLNTAGVRSAGVLGDITIPRTTGGAASIQFMPQAVFPHWIHRTEFKCYACHDEIFQMKAGADNINMDEVRNGRFCGKCHDGKTAFAIGFDTCERCHYSSNAQR